MTGWSIPPAARFPLTLAAILAIWAVQAWVTSGHRDVDRFDRAIRVATTAPMKMDRCSRCHPGACEGTADAPHHRTLCEGNDPKIRERFAGRSFRRGADSPLVTFEDRDGQLWMKSDVYPQPLRVDWMFGSGRHAMTPVSLLTNPDRETELIEGSVSWFHGDVLGETPGATLSGAKGIASLGNLHDHPTTLECFGCHATQLPRDASFTNPQRIASGIGCERCHPGSEQHAVSMENGGTSTMERWSQLTPLESVNRCGECHRRADHLTREELSPERPVLVRFASIGMVMTPCFQQQDKFRWKGEPVRFDCLTCHDPHRPVEIPIATQAAKCLQCHGSDPGMARECSSNLVTDDCLGCHMPPVNVTENLILTDHWIRVRRPRDPPISKGRQP